MLNAIKSETIKLFSLRSTYVYAFFLLAAIAGTAAAMALFSSDGTVLSYLDILTGAGLFILISVAFIGNSVGAAHSDHMTAHAFLTQKSRYQWLAAFTIVAFLFLIALGAVSFGLAVGIVTVVPGVELSTDGSSAIIATVLQLVVYGAMAAGLGVLTRSRVLASVVPLAWMLVVEQLIHLAASAVEGMRPAWLAFSSLERTMQLASGIVGEPSELPSGWALETIQPLWFNALHVGVWTGVFFLAAFLVNQRRDVR